MGAERGAPHPFDERNCSAAIRCNQTQSDAIRRNQTQSAPYPFDKPMGGSERDGRSTANSGAIGATCQWRRGAPTGKPAACLCFQSGTCLQ